MEGLHSSSNFQVLQTLYQSFVDCTKRANYNGYHRHFHVPQFFQFFFLFAFFRFYPVVSRNGKVRYSADLLFFFLLSQGLVEIRRSIRISKSQKNLCVSFSRTDSGLCIYHLFVWSNLNFFNIIRIEFLLVMFRTSCRSGVNLKERFSFVSLFNGTPNYMFFFNAESILVEHQIVILFKP